MPSMRIFQSDGVSGSRRIVQPTDEERSRIVLVMEDLMTNVPPAVFASREVPCNPRTAPFPRNWLMNQPSQSSADELASIWTNTCI